MAPEGSQGPPGREGAPEPDAVDVGSLGAAEGVEMAPSAPDEEEEPASEEPDAPTEEESPAPQPDPDPPSEPPVSEPAEPEPVDTGSATCALQVSVTTLPLGGRYEPRNVGAIWIADASGAFVKSLEVWGNRRLRHVEEWNAATAAAGVARNVVDAVTSATERNHRAHDVSWNCLDYAGQPAPDGTYRVYFEATESNGAGPSHFEEFEKGPQASSLASGAADFSNIELQFTP